MDDPIKIIHKYKNNNGRIQYHIHIFVGDIMDDSCMRILKKIKDVDMYSSLTILEQKEYDILVKNYGEYWYEKFFNGYHINFTRKYIIGNPSRIKELRNIHGIEWVNDHIINYRKKLRINNYSYEAFIKEERERKAIKKGSQKQAEPEELIDYTTFNKSSSIDVSRISNSKFSIIGNQNKPFKIIENVFESKCDEESSLEDADEESDEKLFSDILSDSSDDVSRIDNTTEQIGGDIGDDIDATLMEREEDEFNFEDINENKQIDIFESEVEKDIENIEDIFSDLDEADKNIRLTTKEIKETISNDAYEKINKKMSEFDTNKDNIMFDENLKDVYHKNYITHQYIFKDDTIKEIHNKICCGFKNNNKFGKNTYIAPSYQYLWSEYILREKIEKIMIGHKWIIKNDILKLDIEPNINLGVYEDLRGNLKSLRDGIRRQGKIKREDDENGILYDYEGYYSYNELYMIDLYNELGVNYNPNFEELKNLIDIYLRIYFPKIRGEDMKNILEFLKIGQTEIKKNAEHNKLKLIYDTINNDLIMENEIVRDIELVRKKNVKDYSKLFKENYVVQSVIRAYLSEKNSKVNLFRIFENFLLDDEYPFIQYKPIDGTPRYRYSEKYLLENEKKEIIMKWFENSPYGISFKVKVNEKSVYKYMAINLSDNGRVDYKIQWKEEDMSTVDEISNTYKYIRKLIEKINAENKHFRINLNIPIDDDFKFAFINTIQKFELPNNFIINHNDLSEFSRYFYPYVALVIEPRKRQSKLKHADKNEKSKFGTYLRYKCVSKYENRTKIEHRIIFFMRNYEYDDQSLANEISKEFNITENQAMNEIEQVREKYPSIKKSRKILKKLENIPKYKPPGIGIDIQGKTRNKYKMRIAGARDREQLNRIIIFMNILIYLYTETYLYKKPDRQNMKDKLKRLTKIAKRRNKVDEIVDYDTPIKTIKQMTSIDKKRLSYKAEEDQNQWTRNCQNSGDDKKRRPQQILNVEELTKMGYTWNDKLDNLNFGHYERKIMIDEDGNVDSKKKKKEIILRAIKLPLDDTGENYVYYTCGPEENGKHMYIGFLGKSKNPHGEAMPCCFIKDHLHSKNKEKRSFFLKSIGLLENNDEEPNQIHGDQLYILQDSNKIQEGRFSFLPKYLDIFLNYMMGNEQRIKNHYLISTNSGYYFKYGTKQDEYRYLNALCAILDMSINQMKEKLIKALETDKEKIIFTSLNNGNIRTQFDTIDNYILYIKNNEQLEYSLLDDLICTPGVVMNDGLNIIIFHKKTKIIKKDLEREKIKDMYYIICQNSENVLELKNSKRNCIFIIKENKNYYPIIKVTKESEVDKEVVITKTFNFDSTPTNIINHILRYHEINCRSEYSVLVNEKSSGSLDAKSTLRIMNEINKKEFIPKLQIIDTHFKCRYLITNSGCIIPTLPSGSIYNIPIVNIIDDYLKDYHETYKYLININDLSNSQLKMKPTGLFYQDKKEKSYNIVAIMTESYDAVPIRPQLLTSEYIKKEKLNVLNKPNDDLIDREIIKGPKNFEIDERINSVSKNDYEIELYQLFRLHLSYYLNNTEIGLKYKEKLEQIINDTKVAKRIRKIEVKNLLYQMSNTDLYKIFNNLLKQKQMSTQYAGDIIVKEYVEESLQKPTNIKEIQIIPKDFITDHHFNKLSEKSISSSEKTIYDERANPINTSYQFSKNIAPDFKTINFTSENKNWVHTTSDTKKIDYPNFVIKNNRELCYLNNDRDKCNIYQHCQWNTSINTCLLSLKQSMLVEYINKVAEEFIQNELKAQEILRKGDYFVSDIVDYNIFTERPGERIIMSSNTNLNKILSEIFGKDHIPKIGRRRNKIDTIQNYEQLKIDNPMRENKLWYIQTIVENNNSIFRAFANAYFWLLHPYHDSSYRNLGYYDISQTKLSNIYKSQIIDWLTQNEESDQIGELIPYVKYGKVPEFITKLNMDTYTLTNCLVELYILSKIYECVIYIYDDNDQIIYVFHPIDGVAYDYKKTTQQFDAIKYNFFKKNINLKFYYMSKNIYPNKIEVLYSKN